MSKAFVDVHRPSTSRVVNSTNETNTSESPWLALVAENVNSLHYGVVQIVVHDSRVVQVERTERHRFDAQRGA